MLSTILQTQINTEKKTKHIKIQIHQTLPPKAQHKEKQIAARILEIEIQISKNAKFFCYITTFVVAFPSNVQRSFA